MSFGSLSNYPDNVSGNEIQIAGPDYEYESGRECETCGKTQPGMSEGYHGDHWWTCDVCDTQVTVEDDNDE